MYNRTLLVSILLAGIATGARAQDAHERSGDVKPVAAKAAEIIDGLRPELSEISGINNYKFSLNVSRTKALIPSAIRTGTIWKENGKNNSKGNNYETIDYAELVPILVAFLQEQDAQIKKLQQEVAALKSENANR